MHSSWLDKDMLIEPAYGCTPTMTCYRMVTTVKEWLQKAVEQEKVLLHESGALIQYLNDSIPAVRYQKSIAWTKKHEELVKLRQQIDRARLLQTLLLEIKDGGVQKD